MKRTFLLIWLVVAVSGILTAFNSFQNPEPWVAPASNVKMHNPIKADAKSINAGKLLFTKYCQDCHGKKGQGNGTKAADLKTSPADMTKASFQAQTDGSLFYKISEGRKEMPRAKKDIPDPDDIWNIVNYIRTLGPGGMVNK